MCVCLTTWIPRKIAWYRMNKAKCFEWACQKQWNKKRMKAGEERKTLRGVSWWQNNTYHCVHAKWLVSSISLNIIRLSQSSFIRTCIRMKYKFVRTYGEIAKKAMMVKELESECNFWRVWQRMENKTDAAMIGNVIEMCANASCQSIFSISHSLFRIE